MKLNYNRKRTITTADLFDACDPPLVFEVRTRPPVGWAKLNNEFLMDDFNDPELAKTLIALAFLTVSDDETTYPITTVDQVNELREAIEEGNPGDGDDFLCTIAWGFSTNHFNFLEKNLGNSREPLPQLNGSSGNKAPVSVS